MSWNRLIRGGSILLAAAALVVGSNADTLDVVIGPGPTPHGITASYWHGQTFTPTLPFLTAVEIFGKGRDHPWSGGLVPGTTMTATIYEANGFSGINLNLGAVVASATRTIPMAPPGAADQWNGRFELGTIDVSAYVGQSANQSLAATFTTGAGFGGEETVIIAESNPYPSGFGIQSNNGGSTWTWDLLGPSRDLSFRTYGSSISNSVVSVSNVVVEGTIALQFLSSSNVCYELECTPDPATQPWTSAGWKVTGNGGTMLMYDATGFNADKSYRVREVN
jgi:hypothetical protein